MNGLLVRTACELELLVSTEPIRQKMQDLGLIPRSHMKT